MISALEELTACCRLPRSQLSEEQGDSTKQLQQCMGGAVYKIREDPQEGSPGQEEQGRTTWTTFGQRKETQDHLALKCFVSHNSANWGIAPGFTTYTSVIACDLIAIQALVKIHTIFPTIS